MNNKILYLTIGALATVPGTAGKAFNHKKNNSRPNVLFIFVDDLRRELGAYGCQVKTPNIDALAADGCLFTKQFISCPTSGASRYGLLTGMYPQNTTQLSNEASRILLSGKPENDAPETMFHHLRRNGYYTVGIGKISHYVDGYIYGYTDVKSDKRELPYSWDEMLFNPGKWGTGWNAFFGYADGSNRQSLNNMAKPYECFDGPDNSYPDGLTAELAVSKLLDLSSQDKPFALAVGFFKPHLPFTSPKKYWDMYDESQIELSSEPDIPDGMSLSVLHDSREFGGYRLGDESASATHRVSDEYARKLRHAYFACVSYTDAQVGKVISALKESGQYENTVIILWGDHGWHLGDQRIWGKHTVLETATSSALIIKAPGHRRGVRNDRIVSSIDIYPTLMELCNVDAPDGLQGHSMVSMLDRPGRARWNDVAYSYFNRVMSMRTKDFRLLKYTKDGAEFTELYEYGPDRIEHRNVAAERTDIVKQLDPIFEDGRTDAFTEGKTKSREGTSR